MSEEAADRAIARLTASRLRLRQAMGGGRHETQAPSGGPERPMPRLQALWRCWRRRLRGSPLADAALGALQTMWQRHPWRAGSELAFSQTQTLLLPAVRRHPLATVCLVALGSAALVAAKPWRWGVVSRRLRPEPVSRWVWRQLRLLPLEALLAQLLMMSRQRASQPEDQPTDKPGPPTVEQGR